MITSYLTRVSLAELLQRILLSEKYHVTSCLEFIDNGSNMVAAFKATTMKMTLLNPMVMNLIQIALN